MVAGALVRGGLDGVIVRARGTGGCCSVLVFDVDHFKTANDAWCGVTAHEKPTRGADTGSNNEDEPPNGSSSLFPFAERPRQDSNLRPRD